MTLRARMLSGFVIVVLVLVVALLFVFSSQRRYLIDQIDNDLANAAPLFGAASQSPGLGGIPPRPGPVSDFYFAILLPDDTLIGEVRGALIGESPVLAADDLERVHAAPNLVAPGEDPVRRFTADGFRFRAVRGIGDEWLLSAKPTAEADAAMRRLLLTLGGAVALVLAVMALTTWSMFRLGLQPIARMTRAVGAIASGARDERVEVSNNTTEVGQLGEAFNDMLDQRDAAEDRLRQFVADASHELRTPLTSIRGYLELLHDGSFGPDQLDDIVRRMRGESHRMNDLVDDLLLLAQLDQGRPLRRDPIDLTAIVRDAASDARAMAPSRAISVEVDGPVRAFGDDMRVRQLVANLVQNALIHTPDVSTVVLSTRSSAAGAVAVVSDDGPGLDADSAARVFDRFGRGDPSRSRHSGGSGLGLAIARSVAEAHGGTLSLETAPGSGCTFTLTLPG